MQARAALHRCGFSAHDASMRETPARRPIPDGLPHALPHALHRAHVAELARHLGERERVAVTEPGAITCAVLIPLMPRDGARGLADFDVVYTLRSEHLPSHKGQVAFPGGKRHGDEESLETALRESCEEIGIASSDVHVLGRLDDVSTMAGQYVITPWVGVLPPGYGFRPNPDEVADIFSVLLADLADPQHHAKTTKSWNGNEYEIAVITAGRHEIWGATHQITRNFLDVVAEARSALARDPRR
jgi:8-oxo-dGTP pyrophosphatase MutT (NUDIX family)